MLALGSTQPVRRTECVAGDGGYCSAFPTSLVVILPIMHNCQKRVLLGLAPGYCFTRAQTLQSTTRAQPSKSAAHQCAYDHFLFSMCLPEGALCQDSHLLSFRRGTCTVRPPHSPVHQCTGPPTASKSMHCVMSDLYFVQKVAGCWWK